MRVTNISIAYLLILVPLLSSINLSLAYDQDQTNTTKLGETKCSVHIINGMGSRTLLAHCKSKDDDLGIKSIPVGLEFSWGFKMNFIGTTLFWCYMTPDSNSHVDMKVFWNDRKFTSKCDKFNCFWIAKDDGIYLRNVPRRTEEFVQAWQPGRLNHGN